MITEEAKMRMWNRKEYIFPVDDAYEFGAKMAHEIDRTIEGGMGAGDGDCAVLAQAVRNAGDGDYLELGTFFGGSAILASLTKKKYGLKGDVYCIDDMECLKEKRNAATVMHNAEKMGASIILKVAKTHPFPWPEKRFNCSFIDAAHDFVSCLVDWINVRAVSTKYVLFHDYAPSYSGVVSVVKLANFYPVHISSATAVLENIAGYQVMRYEDEDGNSLGVLT